MLDDDAVRAMNSTDQVITPTMVENYLRDMTRRLEAHTETFRDAGHEAALAKAEYTFAYAQQLQKAPPVDGKPATGPMRDAYATTKCEAELTRKLVAEATVAYLQEAGRNLREAAECGRSVSASVRGNL